MSRPFLLQRTDMDMIDASHLVSLIIGGLITAMVKPFGEWAVSSIRETAAVKTFWRKLRAAFAKENRSVMWGAINMAFWCWLLWRFAVANAPPTRVDILMIAGVVVMLLVTAITVLWDVAAIAVRRRKAAEAETNPLKGA